MVGFNKRRDKLRRILNGLQLLNSGVRHTDKSARNSKPEREVENAGAVLVVKRRRRPWPHLRDEHESGARDRLRSSALRCAPNQRSILELQRTVVCLGQEQRVIPGQDLAGINLLGLSLGLRLRETLHDAKRHVGESGRLRPIEDNVQDLRALIVLNISNRATAKGLRPADRQIRASAKRRLRGFRTSAKNKRQECKRIF
jgi:hypothetical protein